MYIQLACCLFSDVTVTAIVIKRLIFGGGRTDCFSFQEILKMLPWIFFIKEKDQTE